MDRISRAIAHLERGTDLHWPMHKQVALDIFDLQAEAEGWALKRAFRSCIKNEPIPIRREDTDLPPWRS